MYEHNTIALDVVGITKRFVKSEGMRWPWKRNGRESVLAVKATSFQVRRGEIFGIVGPNGSGKSTPIRCLSTLLIPDGGHVSIFGHDVLPVSQFTNLRYNPARTSFSGDAR